MYEQQIYLSFDLLDYRVYPRNDITIRNAWNNVENGRYNLSDFVRNVKYTPEQIVKNEIKAPHFLHLKS